MPAPTATAIQNFLTTALLAKGFVKRQYVDGKLVVTPTQMPDKLTDLVAAVSQGWSNQWTVWQASQAVVAVDSITSAPVLGTPPAALP